MSFGASVARVCLLTSVGALLFAISTPVAAAWPDAAWTRNAPMTISNLGAPLSNYQVKIVLDGSFDFGNAKPDASAVFDFHDGFELPIGDRPLTNAVSAQVTPTYEGSGQIVHPGILCGMGG